LLQLVMFFVDRRALHHSPFMLKAKPWSRVPQS
jgi:hypothetical protein